MAAKFSQGKFTPKNPDKYVGKGDPKWRSSWELTMMRFCDNHPHVVQWASEAIKIPYRNPFTGKATVYVPDFFIVYQDKNGQTHAEVVEVKPLKQTSLENAGRSSKAKAAALLNMAKWEAATHFCKQHNLTFRVITEEDIYRGSKK